MEHNYRWPEEVFGANAVYHMGQPGQAGKPDRLRGIYI